MPPKNMIFIYLICSIMNNVHIYQICDEYFRYDVTANVRIAIPEELEFPSVTLCTDIMQALKWTQMSRELRRYLLSQLVLPEPIIETMVNDGSSVEETVLKLSVADYHVTSQHIYSNLLRRKTIPEILNLTKQIEHLYKFFGINGLFKEPNGSVQLYSVLTTNMSDFQFSIDKTFLHSGLKCFTLSLRPDLHSIINLNDVWNMGIIFSHLLIWQSLSGLRTRVFFHRKGYLISSKDSTVTVERGHILKLTFEVLESILLKHPYNTNCRDYSSTIGLSSRKECREKCIKSKTAHFGFVFYESHAFASDDLYIRGNINGGVITRECTRDCWQKECYSITYTSEKMKEQNLVKSRGRNCTKSVGSSCPKGEYDLGKESDLIVSIPQKPFTRTELQPAISLVSFVTAVLSTFGFWMGLSVSGAALLVRQTWIEALNLVGKIRAKQRLAIRRFINQRVSNSLRQLIPQIVVNLQKHFNFRHRRTHPK